MVPTDLPRTAPSSPPPHSRLLFSVPTASPAEADSQAKSQVSGAARPRGGSLCRGATTKRPSRHDQTAITAVTVGRLPVKPCLRREIQSKATRSSMRTRSGRRPAPVAVVEGEGPEPVLLVPEPLPLRHPAAPHPRPAPSLQRPTPNLCGRTLRPAGPQIKPGADPLGQPGWLAPPTWIATAASCFGVGYRRGAAYQVWFQPHSGRGRQSTHAPGGPVATGDADRYGAGIGRRTSYVEPPAYFMAP